MPPSCGNVIGNLTFVAQRNFPMTIKTILSGALLFTLAFAQTSRAQNSTSPVSTKTAPNALVLPDGFSSSIVFEGLPGARHLAVTKQGGIYVKLSKLKDGKGIIYLKSSGTDGKLVQAAAFGNFPGTEVSIKNDYLYTSSNDDVYRYKLDKNGEVINPNEPEKIIVGLVNRNRDNAKTFAFDNNENIYVNVGSYLGSCLVDPKSRVAPNPCPLLDSVGGVWQFKTNKTNQTYSDAVHYATGFKHAVGIDWNTKSNSLFIMQHGRDQLNDLYPAMFTADQNNMIPAETMYEVKKGADGGWPYVYYDHFQHKQILAPEYGGDGKKEGIKKYQEPSVTFPAHLAPNDLMFYTASQFPAKYRNGAFVAFHGKSPELKKGYLVGFVPFKNGKPSGDWEIFADNFSSDQDVHKPCGLAMGPDGSLYVSDDVKGNIYQIKYGK
ncbi:MAG: sorbosone dehydrogenase [Chitinophagaceae bacterium]